MHFTTALTQFNIIDYHSATTIDIAEKKEIKNFS